jgi:hypothetical protein
MPSQDEVNTFQAIIGRLAALAGDTAATIMREIDEAERADVYPAAVEPFLDASSLISAEWYNSLSEAPFTAEPALVADAETLRYKTDWAATEPDPAQALKDATDRLVFSASQDTVADNALREEVRFARHAQPDACSFCRLLATRGLIYHTRESAEAATKSHDVCHCVIVPERDGDYYLEPDYVDEWRQQYEDALEEVGPATKKNKDAIINHMRRARHAEDPERDNIKQREYYEANKEAITARQRKRYANTKNVT